MAVLRPRTWTAGTAIGLFLFVVAAPVVATNFGGPKDAGRDCDTTIHSQCVANDGSHLVCIAAMSSSHGGAVANKINYYNSMSFLYVTQNPQPCNNADDVIAKDLNEPSIIAFAWTRCAPGATYGGSKSLGTKWCKAQEFVWNTVYDGTLDTNSEMLMVACHEIGHTLGLRHRSKSPTTASCMVTSTISPLYVNPYGNADAHDQAHLDLRYDEP